MKNTSSSLTAFSAPDLIKIFERDLFYTERKTVEKIATTK
jgi:hypothetical protein